MENKKMLGAKSLLKGKKVLFLSFLGAICVASPAFGADTSKSISPAVFAKPYSAPYTLPYTRPYTPPYTAPYTSPYTKPYTNPYTPPYTKPYTPPYKKPHTPLYYQYGSRYGYYNSVFAFRVSNYATLNRVVLEWNADEKADRYLIFRSEGSPNYFKKISESRYTYRCSYPSTSCTQKNYYYDTNVKAGTDYYYKMMYIAKDGRYSLTTYTVKAKTLPATAAKPIVKTAAKPTTAVKR